MVADEPLLRFDDALPIAAAVSEIQALVERHQVVVVAGATGSGKTTQLPKICLLAGRGRIGHTQPRRIAARSVAERIASELGEPLGQTVGYQVRFATKTSRQTRIKVMTDGIMLAEIGHDRELRRYDTIIIDEAHERSLNIDFLLGYLKQLLPRRPDLRVIVTSATIDTARFAEHFGAAPIVEIPGRTFPVELRYRPVQATGGRDADLIDAVCAAVTELTALPMGDILVFCSGEREIRDTAEAINALNLRFTETLPLFARLSAAEQHRVFAPHTGRRVVLATNVAETSLTVPGIRYVVDPGFARMSRYSARTKVQRLPIEPISQASANQRAGRCGRLGPGVCIRLYDEEDFASRPEFTEPEILRTNLASVILQMAEAKLGEITDFPFLEAPDASQVRDGIRLLRELGALAGQGRRGAADRVRLTEVGRKLARLPIDPRLGRMLVEAERQGCLKELQAIVAGLAIQDVRERPADAQPAADAAHRRFWAPLRSATDGDEPTPDGSDIAAVLRLWQYLRDQRRELSGNAFRRMCRDEYLNFLRVREWQDLHTQLREACDELHLSRNSEPAGLDRVHVAVLSGLLSHVGLLADRPAPSQSQRPGRQSSRRRLGPPEYQGARGSRFAINPGSSAANARPDLVMAVELVETTRLWARTVAPIEAAWVEEVGAHLLKRTYSEPHWSQRGGQCVASETVTLLGVPIIAGRTVSYGAIDSAVARDVFIASALVEGQWRTRHHFWARNEAVRAEAEELQERTRRRDLVVDDATIAAFYDARIPAGIVSVAHFDRWWRDARRVDEHQLDLTVADLLVSDVEAPKDTDYPASWRVGELELDIDYAFDPGSGHDGVTVTIPLAALNRVAPADFSWQVPGLRTDVATALIRGLPKQWRTQLVPAPQTAQRALTWLGDDPDRAEPLWLALGRAIRALTGVDVPAQAWDPASLEEHLQVRFRVERPGAEPVLGRDLAGLAADLGGQLAATLDRAAAHLTHDGATDWAFGELPERLGEPVVGYPALVDRLDRVGVRVFATPAAGMASQRAGLRRLIALTTPDPTAWVVSRLSNQTKLSLATSPYRTVPELLADARLRAIGVLMEDAEGWRHVRDATAFQRLRDQVRGAAAATMQQVVIATGEVLRLAGDVRRQLPAMPEPGRSDLVEQLDGLLFPGFIAATPITWWPRLPIYLQAMSRRIQTRGTNPSREADGLAVIGELEDAYARLCQRHPVGPLPEAIAEIGWLLEELRVGLFAQSLRTALPVSAKRVRAAMAALDG